MKEEKRKCPFRKETRYTVHPTAAIHTHVDEEFGDCYKEKCMAYTNLSFACKCELLEIPKVQIKD